MGVGASQRRQRERGLHGKNSHRDPARSLPTWKQDGNLPPGVNRGAKDPANPSSPSTNFQGQNPNSPKDLTACRVFGGRPKENSLPGVCCSCWLAILKAIQVPLWAEYARRKWEATASDVLGTNTGFINNVVVWTEPKLERCRSNTLMRSNAQSVGKQSDSAKDARPTNRCRHEENVGNRNGMTKESEPTPRKLPQRISRSPHGTCRAFQWTNETERD